MNLEPLARAWFRLAAAYFVIGVLLGVAMGASGDHMLHAVHAHINLLGWVSMALFGLIGAACPAIASGRVASAHFWMHNIGVPVMLVALTLRIRGWSAAEPVVGVASVIVGCSVLLYAWLVFARVSNAAQRGSGRAPDRAAS